LLRAFLVAGAFSVMNATPSLIFSSIMGSVSRGALVRAAGQVHPAPIAAS
jgi:hypothetical protein